ncbi:MAG TPA: YgjP-like metallopeptidase domain-containing protein [Sphingomicrobium sp.]|nr:YgjP-like metallopeptidase domain-containing protein [Sphingomicrobium sp.]
MRSRQVAEQPGLPLPVLLSPLRSARRLRLRLDEREQVLKLTYPSRMRAAAALAWAATQRAWVDRQLDRLLPVEPFEPGAVITIDGCEIELCWHEAAPRRGLIADGRLTIGGPREAFGRRVERFLKDHALEILSTETAQMADSARLSVHSVSVGDARTRWGSCSSSGRIRYSWRLILAPPEARRYVVAHEVAHLRHLDHGAGFKAFERLLFGGETVAAQALLREAAPRLRRIGLGR